MDSLPDLGYTSPKRWYDDAFLQEAASSGSGALGLAGASGSAASAGSTTTTSTTSGSASGSVTVSGASDGRTVETSSESQTGPPIKRPKLDSGESGSDVDVTTISMPTCLTEPTQSCSASQSVIQRKMSLTLSSENAQTLTEDNTKTHSPTIESRTEEKELAKQETSADSKSDMDGNSGQDIGKNKKDRLEDEQTKMKLVGSFHVKSSNDQKVFASEFA